MAFMKIDFWNNPLVIHAFESSAGRRKLWSIVLGQPLLLLGLYALLSRSRELRPISPEQRTGR